MSICWICLADCVTVTQEAQYKNVLKYAEEIDTGKLGNFEKLEAVLQKGISRDKFSSINFKDPKKTATVATN